MAELDHNIASGHWVINEAADLILSIEHNTEGIIAAIPPESTTRYGDIAILAHAKAMYEHIKFIANYMAEYTNEAANFSEYIVWSSNNLLNRIDAVFQDLADSNIPFEENS